MAAYFTRSSVSGPGIVPPSPFNPSSISTNLVPAQDNVYSLGISESRWTTAFLTFPPTYKYQSAWYSLNYGTDFIKWIQSSIVSGFWTSSAFPSYSNISPGGTKLSFFGGISLSSGRVILAPNNSSTVGCFNPFTEGYSTMLTPGITLPPSAFNGGVLTPSGKIVFVPFQSGNVCVYNHEDTTMANTFQHNVKTPSFCGGVLDHQGNVTMIPYSTSSNICTYNDQSNTFSNAAFIGANGTFAGGVIYQLAGSTNVVCVPQTNSNVCVFSPQTRTVSNLISSQGNRFSGGVLTSNGTGGYNIVLVPSSGNVCLLTIGTTAAMSNIVTNVPGPRAFSGGCLLPTGNVIMAPFSSSNVGMVDPIKMTYSNSTPVPPNPFAGATLTRDGRVVLVPAGGTNSNVGILNTITPPQNNEFWLSPYFNKF